MKEKIFEYLDRLRESGVTNMFGLGRREAGDLLVEWMTTFEERHKEVI